MYSVNFEVTRENTGKRFLTQISPDGIWKGLKLVDYTFDKESNCASFELMQESSGSFYTQRFYAPDPTGHPTRIKIMLEDVEHFCSAFLPNKINPSTGVNEKWGETIKNFETFEEFCNFYVSKITIPNSVPVDLKVLYTKDLVVVEKGKTKYPSKGLGGRPFISSENTSNTLKIEKDLNAKDPRYNKYLTFTVQETEPVEQIAVPAVAGEDDLPF